MFQKRRVLAALLPLFASRRVHRIRFVLLISSLIFTFGFICFANVLPFDIMLPDLTEAFSKSPDLRPPKSQTSLDDHPISTLIHDAGRRCQELLAKRSFTIEEAAARYRERRGRHPPPGFDVWFAQAQKDDAIVIEEFFDRVHHDITPFWALSPRDMRKQASSQPQVIQVRDGTVELVTDNPNRAPWIQLWTGLVKEMMPHLPDLDMAVNVMDEPRILVPWERINTYVGVEQTTRELIDPKIATSTYGGLKNLTDTGENPYNPGWVTGEATKYWDYLQAACTPDTTGRNVSTLVTADLPVEYPSEPLPYMFKGFIQNFTEAQNPCMQPHLRGMHGTFIESISMSTTTDLFPLFGGSKLPQNNELLIPGAMYLSDREFYNGGKTHGPDWLHKKNGLIWRGMASGGRNKEDTWWHYHRHRWVQMMNGTTVSTMEVGDAASGPTFSLLPKERYNVTAQMNGTLGEWLSSFSDVAFVDLACSQQIKDEVGTWPFKHTETRKTCPYSSPFLAVKPSMSMKKQYDYKFLPDVDGNSFSGRWRAFLQSTSMPLKATIYTEWHDDRLIPWAHFVPFDNSYGDIYAIMDYFLNGHDAEAEIIATKGKEWVNRVYRRADMKLYVWRLLLEYARVLDDRRDFLAFVNDLY